jgi:membrane-bound serine protease (ClpP class)
MGLTLVAFEYFALGPGVAAVVAAISLYLGSYGISILPVNTLALIAAVLAIWLLAASYQKGGLAVINLAATGVLVWAGLSFSSSPLLSPSVPGIVLSILAVLFFFLLAMPAVGKARFSTKTIGREGLIGQRGLAAADFDPDGVVTINGARWPATAHREAAIKAGDEVMVMAVVGREVEVERVISHS